MRTFAIGELVTDVIGGGWGQESPVEGSISVSVIRGADFPDVRNQNPLALPIRFEDERGAEKRKLKVGDIVLEVSGGTKERPTGRVVLVTERLVRQAEAPLIPASFCRRLRPVAGLADSKFLYYMLANWWNRGGAWEYQVQSTGISNFQYKVFSENCTFEVPALSEQRLIGEVLGALDDKIAANQRVIADGDELVAAIYAGMPKSDYGQCFSDVAEVGGGGTPSTKNADYWDDSVLWATPTDVTGADGPWLMETSRKISNEGLAACASPLYQAGSVLMTSRATIGAVVVARAAMAVNQGFIVMNAKAPRLQWWLESQVRARTKEFESWANGATFLELSRGKFKNLPVHECSEADLERFNETVVPIRNRQAAAQIENRGLARTRDELLPLLMTMPGGITVKEAKRFAGDVP